MVLVDEFLYDDGKTSSGTMFVREAGRGAPRQLARLQIRLHLFVHLVDSREALCLTLRCAMASSEARAA